MGPTPWPSCLRGARGPLAGCGQSLFLNTTVLSWAVADRVSWETGIWRARGTWLPTCDSSESACPGPGQTPRIWQQKGQGHGGSRPAGSRPRLRPAVALCPLGQMLQRGFFFNVVPLCEHFLFLLRNTKCEVITPSGLQRSPSLVPPVSSIGASGELRSTGPEPPSFPRASWPCPAPRGRARRPLCAHS